MRNVDTDNAVDLLHQDGKIDQSEMQIINSKKVDREKVIEIVNFVNKKKGSFEVFLNSQPQFVREELEGVVVKEEDKLNGNTCM